MATGTIKFYNETKGFGFIQPEDGGKDVFVHQSGLANGNDIPQEGETVSFDLGEDNGKGPSAVNVSRS
jgi:CspA family cold shock protein